MAQVSESGDGQYTKDGSVDLKGRPVLRSKKGGWTACSFVIVYEVFERMAFHGISANLVLYLTRKLRQGTVASANNVTNWVGTGWITPILGAYVADAHLGRYWTLVISCIIYLSGMILLALSVSVPSLKPPACNGSSPSDGPNCAKTASPLQLGVFFFALYVLAIATGGTKPNISTIGADQFDDFDPNERSHKLSFFNWWMFSIFLGTLFATSALVYIQDNVGWTLGYAIPTVGLAISIAIFLAGTRFYRHKKPSGSPFTKMARVFVAAIRKWRVSPPVDAKELHELELEHYTNRHQFRIESTPTLSFLNKAAIVTGPTSPWILCPVTQVEETKQILRMLPILVVSFIPSAMLAQVITLFVKQGTTLDRSMGPNFQIPPAALTSFTTISMLVSVVLYDRYFMPLARRWTKNPRGISLLQRIGAGFIFHIVIMVVASVAERHRLAVANDRGKTAMGDEVPLSVFILLPQFSLMGVADAILEVGKIEFFYDQAPESMKSLGTSFSLTTLGVGNFLSSFMLSTAAKVTRHGDGHEGWIRNNLNRSHFDYYYAFFAVLNLLNFVAFLFVSSFYVYRAETNESLDGFSKDGKDALGASGVVENTNS